MGWAAWLHGKPASRSGGSLGRRRDIAHADTRGTNSASPSPRRWWNTSTDSGPLSHRNSLWAARPGASHSGAQLSPLPSWSLYTSTSSWGSPAELTAPRLMRSFHLPGWAAEGAQPAQQARLDAACDTAAWGAAVQQTQRHCVAKKVHSSVRLHPPTLQALPANTAQGLLTWAWYLHPRRLCCAPAPFPAGTASRQDGWSGGAGKLPPARTQPCLQKGCMLLQAAAKAC